MKKKICALAIGLMLGSSICSASISPSSLALGGLQLGATATQIKQVYGEPDDVEIRKGTYDWLYGKGVRIGFPGDEKSDFISVSAANGWTTPEGLAVGMPAGKAIKLYGFPDGTKLENGLEIYMFRSTDSPYKQLWVHADPSGNKIIKQISVLYVD